MLRLIAYLFVVVVLATGLSWLADRPGNLVVNWQGYLVETSVFRAIVLLTIAVGFAVFVWSVLRNIWYTPAAIGNFFNKRRQKRGLDALSGGMIAIGAGDPSGAMRYAVQARKSLPNEPLTHLLRAQTAQLTGDKATARRIFEAMLASPDTEQLGLRGLFLEAEREGEQTAAIQFAERAIKLNQKLSWPVDALFDLHCKNGDWADALKALALARKNGHIERNRADRRKAVLLTAQAQDAEDNNPETALNLALEAHKLAVNLVPATAIAARILAARGNTPRATKIIQKTWAKQPHPDLATAYAYARLGDSPRDRLERIKKLAGLNPHSLESPIAIATTAIEARDFDTARAALNPLLEGRLTQRICTLMARIEGEEHGDTGRVREWLARAVNAPRDPAWTADGVVSEQWAAVSPATGALDAFQWRVPVENVEGSEGDLLARKLEEFVALGAGTDGGTSGNATGNIPANVKDITPETDEDGSPSPTTEPRSTTAAARPLENAAVETIEALEPAPSPVQPTKQPDKKPPVVDSTVTTSATTAPTPDNSATQSEPKTKTAPKEAAEKAPAATAKVAATSQGIADDTGDSAQSKTSLEKRPAKTRARGKKPVADTKASPKSQSGAKGKVKSRKAHNIFVSPPAPDDPGPRQ